MNGTDSVYINGQSLVEKNVGYSTRREVQRSVVTDSLSHFFYIRHVSLAFLFIYLFVVSFVSYIQCLI